jgi:hypothetical protein
MAHTDLEIHMANAMWCCQHHGAEDALGDMDFKVRGACPDLLSVVLRLTCVCYHSCLLTQQGAAVTSSWTWWS